MLAACWSTSPSDQPIWRLHGPIEAISNPKAGPEKTWTVGGTYYLRIFERSPPLSEHVGGDPR
jgi:hypothetical protein